MRKKKTPAENYRAERVYCNKDLTHTVLENYMSDPVKLPPPGDFVYAGNTDLYRDISPPALISQIL